MHASELVDEIYKRKLYLQKNGKKNRFYTKCWGGQRIEQKNKKKREHI